MGDASELRLAIEAADPESAEVQVLELARELRAVRGIVVTRPSAAGPVDSKSGNAVTLGTIGISLASGGIAPLMMILHEWVKRRRRPCSVSVEIGDATLTFPEVELDEAMEILRRHGFDDAARGASDVSSPPANSDV